MFKLILHSKNQCPLMFIANINFHCSSYRFREISTSEQPKPFESIPGLPSLPLIGNLHNFLPVIGKFKGSTDIFNMADYFYKNYGPVVKMTGLFNRQFVFLFEPEMFDQVYRAEDATQMPLRPGFEVLVHYRSELRKDRFNGVFGLTTALGSQWRDFRTKVNPALLKPKLVKLYSPGLEKISEDMVKRLIKLKDKDSLRSDLDQEMTKWSLEAVALVCLGDRLGCLQDGDLPEDHPGKLLIKCAKDIIDLSFKLETMPNPWRYIATPNYKKLIKTLDLQWEMSEMYIKEAKKKINDRGFDVADEDKSVIERLLAIDETVAVMMANEMLLAGIDTVSFTTIGLLYRLASNPKVQDKLREEIRSGDPQKRYLKACLKESLRLWPAVSANSRQTSKEHVVGGYLIPKGIHVIAPNQYLSALEKYYPRPQEYIPERWLVEKTDPLSYGNAHPMVTLPFGFGIRSCIGRRIAELEIETLITQLIDKVKISWDGPPLELKNHVMNSYKKPFHFKFEALN